MALLPRALRPSVIIRRKAIRQGLLGPSLFWKVMAGWVFGKKTVKKFFGKQPEKLGSWKVASNQFVNVINAKPQSKKQAAKSGTSKRVLRDLVVAQAVADVRSKNPDAKIVVKSK
jgi:hypothetical protein